MLHDRWQTLGARHGQRHHFLCGQSMSWMFTRGEGMDRFVNVRPTMLDDAGWFHPFLETFASTKLPFAETGAARSFAEFPAPEEYEGLLEEYREWAG